MISTHCDNEYAYVKGKIGMFQQRQWTLVLTTHHKRKKNSL
jgi:hypothetical protein